MATTSGAVKIQESRHDHAFATWRNFAIVIWRHDTKIEAIEAAQAMSDELMRANPGGINWLTVIDEHATMPTPEARTKINAVMNKGASRTLRSALVFEGTGFRAAATRSIVTGIGFVSPFPFPHKIFSTLNTACAWFAGAMKNIDPADLARAVETARAVPGSDFT